jgi:hypothetical protein
MSTALIIGGVVLGAVVLASVAFMGKKREESEDTGFGVSNLDNSETQSGGKHSRRQGSRKRKSRSRRSKRVKI